MNNEEPRLINDESLNTETPVNSALEKKSPKGKVVAAAASGFVAGAAIGVATGAVASNVSIEPEKNEEVEKEEALSLPEPSEVILANSEGIRFAHVEADNFEDAFAQAREQVGPGGAFEYEGKIYGTYCR